MGSKVLSGADKKVAMYSRDEHEDIYELGPKYSYGLLMANQGIRQLFKGIL
jgi:hypothetical protein